MDTGFPTVVWCLCWGLGFDLTLPFLAVVQGACPWARVWALPRQSWPAFVVRAFVAAFRGDPAKPGSALGCVCLDSEFGCAPPFLARVWCMCVGLHFSCTLLFLAGVFGAVPSCARSVRFPPPRGWAACGVGLCGSYAEGFAEGGVCGCGSRPCRVVALWWSPSRIPVLGPLVSAPPPPFVWVPRFSWCVRVAAGRSLLRWGVRRRVWGALSSGPSVAVWLWWAAAFGWVAPGSAGWSPGVLSGGPVGVVFGVAWLGGLPASCGVDAQLRGCVTDSPFFLLFHPSERAHSVAAWGFPPSCNFFLGGFACSSLCLPWAGARTGWYSVWLIRSLLLLWVAVGRARALCIGWVMYTLGLMACSVGLGAGSADWAVAPADFVKSWVRGGGVILFSPAPAVPGLTFWWQFVRAGCRCRGGGGLPTGVWWPLVHAWRAGVALSHGSGRVSFLSRL